MIGVRYHASAGITLLLTLGCSSQDGSLLIEPATSINAQRASGWVARPFQGGFQGQLTFIPPFQPGSLSACNAQFSGDPAHPGPSVSAFDEASGVFSIIGSIRLRSTFCFDPDSPDSEGTGVLAGMNGDQILIGFANTAGAPDADGNIPVSGTQSITGGTGRFADASGDQVCRLVVDALTLRIRGQCDGVILYDPSR